MSARIDVLVVDGANVVGSRPDGWWRDRPGAAARLQAQLQQCLAEEPGLATRIVLVLEGRARAGVPEGMAECVAGSLRVVHAHSAFAMTVRASMIS